MSASGPFLAGYPDRLLGQPGTHRDPLDPTLRLIVGKGTASWQVYLPGGQRLGLGRLPAVSVNEARSTSERMRRRVQAGLGPRGAMPAGSQSLGEMVTAWERRKEATGVTSAPERAAAVRRHVTRLLSVPVRDLTADDLDLALRSVKQDHPLTARNVVATLRAVFNDVIRRKLILVRIRPCSSTSPRRGSTKGSSTSWR